jgi:hypothetical protein
MRIRWAVWTRGRRDQRSTLQQADDLAGLRMSAQFRLLEDRLTVSPDLEPSASGGSQLNFHVGKGFAQLGRQTDGPGFVRSNGAILDFDFHTE